MGFLPALDGAELSFVFVFGFLVALWSRRVFAAPAVFLLLQYGALWPLIMPGTKSDDTIVFLVSDAATVWCGSVSGICTGAILGSERLLHRRDAALRPTAMHLALLCAMAASVWMYVSLRGAFPPPWPSGAAVLVAALADTAAWYAWAQPAMYVYFPRMRDVRWFVAAVAACKLAVLVPFCGIDYMADALSGDALTSLALRGIVVATITLVLVVVRLSPCYRRIKHERVSLARGAYRFDTGFFLQRVGRGGGGSNSSSNSSDEKTDSDYVEYG